MLRLAFDFIITWRETRTRPNAYSEMINLSRGIGQTHYIFYYIIPCYLFVILLIINALLFDYVDCFSCLYKIY